jgi:hypothetical protein
MELEALPEVPEGVLHCLFSSCKTQVPNIASFSGLSILDFLLVFFDIKANVFLFSQA